MAPGSTGTAGEVEISSMRRRSDWLIYAGVRSYLTLLRALPYRVACQVSNSMAGWVYQWNRKHRQIGLINLRIAFPDRPPDWCERILRASYASMGRQVVELSRLPGLTAREVVRRVSYEPGRGLENYLQAREQGNGVLYLTAHFGAWELLPAAQALYGYPLAYVVRPLDNPYLEDWLASVRSRFANQVFPKRGSVRRALKRIRSGGDVGFLIDQNMQEKEGVFAPFFGRPASTTTMLAALALRTTAPVIPGFIYPLPKLGHYRIRFYPAVEIVRSGDRESDLVENTSVFNRYVEDMIREFPEQWVWGHRRFHTQPDGTSPYPS